MNWSVSEAKARLSEVLKKARRSPQVIESRGEEIAVVMSKVEFERLQSLSASPRRTAMADFIAFTDKLRAEGDMDFELPKRELESARPPLFDEDD